MRPRLGVDVADPSTWRGLGMMVVGYAMDAFTPDTNRWFIPLMLIIVGAVGFFVREDRPEPIKRKVKKSRPIQSRGFDKRFRKTMRGEVVPATED